jgi:hypothetical protein
VSNSVVSNSVRMKSLPALLLLAFTFGSGSEALSQVIVPGINAPPFPSPPSQQIQSPPILQFGVALQPNVSSPPQNSFGDRVTECLLQGSLAGLTAGDLSAYAGECASQ